MYEKPFIQVSLSELTLGRVCDGPHNHKQKQFNAKSPILPRVCDQLATFNVTKSNKA